MSYSKIDAALRAVLPDGVFRLEAPERPDGIPLTRYIVWTPTGSRSLYAEGSTAIRIYSAVVTVVSQTDDDPLVGQVLAALHGARPGAFPSFFDSYEEKVAKGVACGVKSFILYSRGGNMNQGADDAASPEISPSAFRFSYIGTDPRDWLVV